MNYLLIATIIILLYAVYSFVQLKRLFFPKNKIAKMQEEIDNLRKVLEVKNSNNSNLKEEKEEQLSMLADFNGNFWADY